MTKVAPIAVGVAAIPALFTQSDTITEAREPLRIFTTIPELYGVVVMRNHAPLLRAGEVAVYDQQWTNGKGPSDPLIEDGGLYALEYQKPHGGMTWEMWWENGQRYGGRTRIHTSIEIGICTLHKNGWHTRAYGRHPLGFGLCSDGPYRDEYHLAERIVGKIVGIYMPQGGAQ